MIPDPQTAWEMATHMAELVGAHGLVEAGKKATHRLAGWVRGHLPKDAQAKLDAVENDPTSRPKQADLAVQIDALLAAQPSLLEELRDLLADAKAEDGAQVQTVGDNSRGVQNKGDKNSINVSG